MGMLRTVDDVLHALLRANGDSIQSRIEWLIDDGTISPEQIPEYRAFGEDLGMAFTGLHAIPVETVT